jgi:hypothetical protein
MAKKTGAKSKSVKSKAKSSKLKSSELNIIKSPLMEGLDKIENQNSLNNKFKVSTMIFNIIMMTIVLSIIILIINVNALLWINKLDTMNCACSESYMRTYIKYYLYFNIVIISIDLLLNIYLYTGNILPIELVHNPLYGIYTAIKSVFFIFSVINIVIVIIFINKLKELNCECSEDIRREVYWIYNIILACYIGIVILLAMIGLFAMLSNK